MGRGGPRPPNGRVAAEGGGRLPGTPHWPRHLKSGGRHGGRRRAPATRARSSRCIRRGNRGRVRTLPRSAPEATPQKHSGGRSMHRKRRSRLRRCGTLLWNASGRRSRRAVDLLNLFAFLPSDGILRSLLVQQADRLPSPLRGTVRNQLALDAAIAALRRYSLVDTTPDGFIVHRLVQVGGSGTSGRHAPRGVLRRRHRFDGKGS